MYFLNWTSDADPGMPTRAEVAEGTHWNLWRLRQVPFNELADGSDVVLVDTWPGGGRLSWQVKATHVVAEPYGSKAAVVNRIASGLSLPASEVRRNGYTLKGPDAGYVLAWRYRPVRRLAIPRPPDLRFRPNGWLRVDDPAVLRRWGIDAATNAAAVARRKSPIGQGRLSHDERVAVEARAMSVATDWCRSHGWPLVEDVSARSSWDLEARSKPSRPPLYVEVKGTTGKHATVEVTAAEVRHARENPLDTALIVVTNIALTRGATPTASGGQTHVWHPWTPNDAELTATMYRWRSHALAGGGRRTHAR